MGKFCQFLTELSARDLSLFSFPDDYTPDIRSMWGYIVFAFPFVRSFVRTFVRSFVRLFVRSFVRLSVTGSKFLR